MKLVINKCYGGFGLSKQATELLGIEWDRYGYSHADSAKRADPKLVAVVEHLGKAANGEHARLAVVEIPDGTEYTIEEAHGIEWVAEKHKTWG